MVSAKPDENSVEIIVQWRFKIINLVNTLYASIESFKNEIEVIEINMDALVTDRFNYWYSLINECSFEDPKKEMQNEIKKYRKTSEFENGKLAITGLKSKVFQNQLMISKVEEFLMMIPALKITYYFPKLHEKEVDVQKKINEINKEYEISRSAHSKNLIKEMNAIKTEIKDTSISKRVLKCHEFLQLINDLDKDNHLMNVETLKSVIEKCCAVHNQFVEKIDQVFSITNLGKDLKPLPLGPNDDGLIEKSAAGSIPEAAKSSASSKSSTPQDKARPSGSGRGTGVHGKLSGIQSKPSTPDRKPESPPTTSSTSPNKVFVQPKQQTVTPVYEDQKYFDPMVNSIGINM